MDSTSGGLCQTNFEPMTTRYKEYLSKRKKNLGIRNALRSFKHIGERAFSKSSYRSEVGICFF